jgi:hypothetical protein
MPGFGLYLNRNIVLVNVTLRHPRHPLTPEWSKNPKRVLAVLRVGQREKCYGNGLYRRRTGCGYIWLAEHLGI